MVTHARACKDERIYGYVDSQKKTLFSFNILGEVLESYSYSNNQYMPSNKSSAEAQELLTAARQNWEAAKSFDDSNSLCEYLTSLCNNESASKMVEGEKGKGRGELCDQSSVLLTSKSSEPNLAAGNETGADESGNCHIKDDHHTHISQSPALDHEVLTYLLRHFEL